MALDEIINRDQKPSCDNELPTDQEISSVIIKPQETKESWCFRKPSPENHFSYNRNRRDHVQKGSNWGGIQRRPKYTYNRNAKAATWRRNFYSEIARQETSSGKITLSNLGPEVTEEDIGLLFTDIGPLLSCRLDYDRSGRTLGTATVVFEYQSDAIRALNMYNGAYLDGRLMHMQLVSVYGTVPCWNVSRPGHMNGVFRPAPAGWSQQPSYQRRGYSGGRKRSFQELDDELDEYMRNA